MSSLGTSMSPMSDVDVDEKAGDVRLSNEGFGIRRPSFARTESFDKDDMFEIHTRSSFDMQDLQRLSGNMSLKDWQETSESGPGADDSSPAPGNSSHPSRLFDTVLYTVPLPAGSCAAEL